MQALSSSALGAPVEEQAASGHEQSKDSFAELRRAALEQIDASQRHRTGVLPGMICAPQRPPAASDAAACASEVVAT